MAIPTWYDILGVEPDATPEQIKAAWRDATDKFEPGTGAGQFRMFNEAADILLDPEKRRAYDAELGLTAVPVETAPEPDPEPDPEPEPAAELDPTTEPEPALADSGETVEVEPQADREPDAAAAPTTRARRLRNRARAGLTSTLGLAILAVLTVAALVLTVFLAIDLQDRADVAAATPNSYSPDQGADAVSVAERAVAATLSYDYRKMEADRAAATKFMTTGYEEIYVKNFDGLLNGTADFPGVVATKAVVTATVLSSAVVDATPKKVRVLVFANQTPSRDGKGAAVLGNRLIATMVREGGDWLLDDLDPLGPGF